MDTRLRQLDRSRSASNETGKATR